VAGWIKTQNYKNKIILKIKYKKVLITVFQGFTTPQIKLTKFNLVLFVLQIEIKQASFYWFFNQSFSLVWRL
jgi:hypothetical protein